MVVSQPSSTAAVQLAEAQPAAVVPEDDLPLPYAVELP
jgi:hypothetical protein